MVAVQFAAQTYQTRASQLLNQRCINAFVEPTPKQGKTAMPVYGCPGLSLFSRMGPGPILGLHIINDDLYVLSGPDLYRISGSDVDATAAGLPVPNTLIGATTISGIASMADNGNQLIMVDGNVGWIYQPGGLNIVSTINAAAGDQSIACNITGLVLNGASVAIPLDNGATFTATSSSLAGPADGRINFAGQPLPGAVTAGAILIDSANTIGRLSAPAFKPASTVRYFDGYFVFDASETRQFFISSINDGTQYSGLDFATASAGSDRVRAVEVYHEQLLIMCERHIEVWWDTGNAAFPFQRYDAALIARGLPYPYGVCSEDNTVFWMADDGIFYRLEGFSPKRVSNFGTEHAWAQYPRRFLDASCFVLDQEGHKFVVVNFQSGQATWVYDIAASVEAGMPLWHERESWGTPWV